MNRAQIYRGEIWLINLDPTIGSEIKKTRPGVILSSDALSILPIKIVAPLTAWKSHFSSNIWHIRLKPNKSNGLTKTSAADLLQIKSLDEKRFIKKLGTVSKEELKEMNFALLNVIDYES